MARRRIDPAQRSRSAQAERAVRSRASSAGRSRGFVSGLDKSTRRVTGVSTPLAGGRGKNVGMRRSRRGMPTTAVAKASLKPVTGGEAVRLGQATKMAGKLHLRDMGKATMGQQNRSVRRQIGTNTRSRHAGVLEKLPTRSRARRSVFMSSKGRSGSGARRVFKRDPRGRFA